LRAQQSTNLSPTTLWLGLLFWRVTANSFCEVGQMARVMPTQVVQTIDALFPRAVKNQGNVN